MDPVSRRYVWKHIDSIKEGKVILLTTHAMEEADLLADSVAVMRQGNLAAYGTPLELKSQYGSALQFSLLVDPSQALRAEMEIKDHFKNFAQFTTINVGDAGNITLKISSIQTEDKAGVDVQVLTDFVEWLESTEVSGVTEYGFSNSSLEEVFLAVTQAQDEQHPVWDGETTKKGCCCCRATRLHAHVLDAPMDGNHALGFEGDQSISKFTPVLSTWRQTQAVLRFSFARNWLGSGARASWIFHVIFVGLSVLFAVLGTNTGNIVPFLVAPTLFLSMGLISFVSPIYRDRNNGLFYLMKTQGLLKSGYLMGMGLYSFLVQLVFGLTLLSLVFTTGMFREPQICPIDNLGYCRGDTWSYTRLADPIPVLFFQDDSVALYATWHSGGYMKIVGAAVAFALTMPGAVFSAAYLPGLKFAVTLVLVATLLVSMAPLIAYFLLGRNNIDGYESCQMKICDLSQESNFTGVTGEKFLNCIGLQVNAGAVGSLCMPARTAILPQFGLFQMLSMTAMSDITFVSDPPEFVSALLIPSLGGGVKCNGNTCQFPYAQERYGIIFGFTLLGALLLLILGVSLVSVFSFPDPVVLKIKSFLGNLYKCAGSLLSTESKQESATDDTDEPFEEVVTESALVSSFVRNRRKTPESEEVEEGAISRENLPPVLAHKLRMMYPSLGGRPPKVALVSLDLHVPKGQVLGLLGQNGAGT
jgi:hypothetical protein